MDNHDFHFFSGLSLFGEPRVNEDVATDAPLLVAARKKQKETVESLIASGADIKCVSKRGWTVLHHAAMNGWLDIVKSLVDKGAELDVKLPQDLRTPLLLAAAENHTNVVTFLIKVGADIACRDKLNRTVFYYACSKGMLDVVQLLSERGFDLENSSSNDWPLFVAAENHQREIVQFLIESGANVNIADAEWTLLHYAARNGWPKVVRLLVERVENCDAMEYVDFETPLHFACRFSMIRPGVMMRFEGQDERNKFLEKAVSDVVEIIEILTEKGSNINFGNIQNETPAHLSFTYLMNISVDKRLLLRVLNCLFKAGADCNIKDFYGRSLFQRFISSDYVDFVRLGIENGGYFEDGFDISMDQNPNIIEHILKNVSYCTRALVNKYNLKELPAVYKKCDIGDTFPSIKIMKIGSDSGIVKEIEKAVNWDIEAQGYCNILQISPLSLSLLIVKSILKQ